MNKRILSILLTLCMLLCLVPTGVFAEGETAENADITGSGTQDDSYLIYTAEGLKAFRDKANGGERYAFATLMNDIVLNDGSFDADGNYTAADGSTAEPEKWTPIGTDNNQYRGTFDGNGKTVKGLYVNTGGDEPAGLFGSTGGPKIKNLTVDGCVIGKDWAGGILGFSHGGVIENCTNNASVTVANLDSDRHACVGGIAGVTYAKLIGCGNTGKITVKNVAQIANVGGIVGCQNNMGLPIIHDCYNTGEVSGEAGKLYLGGIVGAISQGVISNCYSTGKLDSTGSTTVYLGSIVGLNGALYNHTNNYYLEGTADKAAGRDEEEMVDKNTVKPMPKEAFEDGTILNLMINGREDGTHPWSGECGYVESAGMVLPILKREESVYAHTHCICGTGTDFDGHDTHTDVTWTPWTKTDRLPTKSGYYFLTDDVVMNIDQTTSSEGIYMCLNGYSVKIADTEDESNNPALLLNGGTLAITDCSTKGTVNDITIYSGKLIMYGGSVPVGSRLTLAESGELFASGNTVINGTVTNEGTILSGIFNGEVINEKGTINGGTFNSKVTNKGGDIYNGIFSSDVDSVPFPYYREDLGMTVGSRTSFIHGGTFTETSRVNNVGCVIQNGTFSGSVINNGYSDGTSSYGLICGGIFTETSVVTILRSRPELPYKEGCIKNGKYYGRVNLDGGVIDDGEFTASSEVDLKSGKVFGGVYYGKVTFGEAVIHDNACRHLTFDTDGGSVMDAQRILRGQKATTPTEKPVKTGHIFSGWTAFDFTKPMLENATLTAVWSECDHSGNTAKPTCTEPAACTVCGGTIAALGHDFSEQGHNEDTHWEKCSRCGAKNNENLHDWDSGKVTVQPTCMTEGEKIFTCDKCGATKSDPIPASGHSWAQEWQHDEMHHWPECLNSYCDVKDNDSAKDGYSEHTGGNATCTEKAKCEVCGENYGSLDADNHTGIAEWTKDAQGHEKKWSCCGAVIVASEAHEWLDGVCGECEYVCAHADTDKNHICDICGETISDHEDTNKDHVCDYCGVTLSECADDNKDHECDYCGATLSKCADDNSDHKCDYCDAILSECIDADNDHICDICGKVLSDHSGGKATCKNKAVCEVCGKAYGEIDTNNHSDLKHIEAKAATKDAEGNIEYWHCEGCGKYYGDATAAKEIKKDDTVTAKLPDEPRSPQTIDNSNLMLWIALLFISGGVTIGTTVVSKKRKHNS